MQEVLVGVGFNTQVALNLLQLSEALVAVDVQLRRDLANLRDLRLEALVLSFLALICLEDDVVEDVDLFLQVTLNVVALCNCNRFDSILLTLELADLLARKTHISLQLDDFLLQLVNSCLEAEGLLRAERRRGLSGDGCSSDANLALWEVVSAAHPCDKQKSGGSNLAPVQTHSS